MAKATLALFPTSQPGFDRWWKVYPVKKGRVDAEKAFNKLNPDAALLDEMCDSVESEKAWDLCEVRAGRWVPRWPYPATYIRGRRWEDEA